jgi:hypothetical protein
MNRTGTQWPPQHRSQQVRVAQRAVGEEREGKVVHRRFICHSNATPAAPFIGVHPRGAGVAFLWWRKTQ